MNLKRPQRKLFRKDCAPPIEPLLGGYGGSPQLQWLFVTPIRGESYVCGFCGSQVAPSEGAIANCGGLSSYAAKICICHNCSRPTFFDTDGRQYPEQPFGSSVGEISDQSVNAIYEEARRAMTSGAYTAAVMCCRTLLMHIAVEQGDQPGKSFVQYVEFLCKKFAPSSQDWIDQIRKAGNKANHKIVVMNRENAVQILQFTEMLLKIIYEYPAAVAIKNGRGKAS